VKCESSHKPVGNCSSKITSGQAITESPVQQKLVNHFSKGSSSSKGKSAKKSVKRVNKKTQNKSSKSKKVQTQKCKNVNDSQQPSTSHIYVDDSQSESSGESEIEESELCCVCKKFTPEELRKRISLVFAKWAQCDRCSHWVHLVYCTTQRVIRRGDEFLCMHCV
jgi:hypothetical protein